MKRLFCNDEWLLHIQTMHPFSFASPLRISRLCWLCGTKVYTDFWQTSLWVVSVTLGLTKAYLKYTVASESTKSRKLQQHWTSTCCTRVFLTSSTWHVMFHTISQVYLHTHAHTHIKALALMRLSRENMLNYLMWRLRRHWSGMHL